MTTRRPVEYSVDEGIVLYTKKRSKGKRDIQLIHVVVPDCISTRYGQSNGQSAQLYYWVQAQAGAAGKWKPMYYSEMAWNTLLREQRMYTLEYDRETGTFVAKLLPVRVSTPPNVPDVQD